MTTQHSHRPEWVQKAAEAVTALYQHQQRDVEHAKANVQTSEARLKTNVKEMEEKVADIIHRHAEQHK